MAECACETCIYRKNCQFLGRHPKTVVAECTAYESEDILKHEVAQEIFNDLADEVAWFIHTVLKKKYWEK